jgi:hypothetical protein
MPTNKMRNRKPGETKLYDSGKKFNDIYNHSDVYGDKLSEEKRKEINKNSADLNEAFVSHPPLPARKNVPQTQKNILTPTKTATTTS